MGGSKKSTVGYRYRTGAHMVLGVGPWDSVRKIRYGDKTAWEGVATGGSIYIDQPHLYGGDDGEGGIVGNIDIMMGLPTQARNAYLLARQGPLTSAYRGAMSLVFRNGLSAGFYWGNSPYFKTIKVTGTRVLATADGSPQWYAEKAAIANPDADGPDMNPAHIIREALTRVKGYSSARIDDDNFRAVADTLHAEGFGVSIYWRGESTADDLIASLRETIDAKIYISPTTGKWTIKLIRADYDIEDLPALGKGQIKRIDDYSTPVQTELPNSCAVTYWSQADGSNATVQSDDPALIIEAGAFNVLNRDCSDSVTSAPLAARIAQRDRIAASSPLRTCTITATRAAASLMPGDAFVLDWPALMESPTVMRVNTTKRGGLLNHKIVMECIEDVFVLDASVPVSYVPPKWDDPSEIELAQAVPLAIEAPYSEVLQRYGATWVSEFLGASPDSGMILATAAQSAAAINAIVTGDGTQWPTLADLSPRGTLTAGVSQTATALPITWSALPAAGTHIQIGAEIMRFDGLTGSLSNVGRGCLDTVPAVQSSGAAAWAWDVFAVTDEVERAQGEAVSITLQLRNNSRVGAASSPVVVTLDARAIRPYPPGRLRIGGLAYPAGANRAIAITWAHRNRLTQADQLIDESVASITPEAGTTYSLRVLRTDTNAVLYSQTGLTGTAHTVPALSYDGQIRIEVWSVRDGLESLQRARHTLDYLRTEAITTETDEPMTTESGEQLITET